MADVLLLLLDLNGSRLRALDLRNEQCKHAVAIFRLDAIRIDLNGKGQGTIEFAPYALTSVQTGTLFVVDNFLTPDANGVLLRLDLQIILADTRKFNNRDEAIALLKYVDRRIGTSAGRRIPEPITFQAGIESSLKTEQGFEWIAKSRDHDRTPQMPSGCRAVRVAGAYTQFAPFGAWIWEAR
jgi:hypothetical protein